MTTLNFHPPYGFYNLAVYKSAVPHTLSLALGYSYATRKSYTRISPLHGKEDCWHFRGVYELPHSHLTRIQRRLLIVASITLPTHMLPLIAIVNAPHHRFGGSPLYFTSVALCETAAIHKYPCFVALTLSACVSAHWFRASTLSSYYSDRLSRNQRRREKASILVP